MPTINKSVIGSADGEELIKNFVESLIIDKGLDGLEPDFVDVVRDEIYERVNNRLMAVVLRSLPTEELDNFEKVIEGEPEQVQSFISAKIPDLSKLVADELLNFRAEYLAV